MDQSKSGDAFTKCFIIRRLKVFASFDALSNSIGFGLLTIIHFTNLKHDIHAQTIHFILSFLTTLQIITFFSIKWCVRKDWQISNPHKIKQNHSLLSYFSQSYSFTEAFTEVCHFCLILVQPSFFYSNQINNHLTALSFLRVYTLVAYFFGINISMNPRIKRVTSTLGINPKNFGLKIKFKRKYFYYLICGIAAIIIIGFGNVILFYQQSEFDDIIEASYFIFQTMSTVGYGDFEIISPVARTFCVISILLGNMISSLMTYKVLKSTKMNMFQKGIYHLNKKLAHNQSKEKLFGKVFQKLLDNQDFEYVIDNKLEQKHNGVVIQDNLHQVIKQESQLESINPVKIVNLIDKTRNWIPKIRGMNLINQYISSPIQQFLKKQQYPKD